MMTLTSTGASDPGGYPEEEISPDPIFEERPY